MSKNLLKDSEELRQQLEECLENLQLQKAEFIQMANELGVSVFAVRTTDGSYIMVPLLLAEAHILGALAELLKISQE